MSITNIKKVDQPKISIILKNFDINKIDIKKQIKQKSQI